MFVTISTIGVFETVPHTYVCPLPKETDFQDMIELVASVYPEFKSVLCSPAIESIVILRNGQSLLLQNGFFTRLADGDDIFIAPMTHGG